MISFGGVTYGEMADSISPQNLNSLPFTPDAYLGYVDGRWPDYAQIAAQHADKPCFGVTVWGDPHAGQGSDDEPGNTTVAQTPAITAGELARGVILPIVYCPASWATDMVNAHTNADIDRSKYRLLTAHYQGPTAAGAPISGMHICGPATCRYGPGSDGTQWQDAGPYDRTLLAPRFLTLPGNQPVPSHPGPAPMTTLGDHVLSIPFSVTLNAAGWTAEGVTLPSGMTKDNIVSVVLDGASPYDANPADQWETASGVPDFKLCQPGTARIVVRGTPNHFYTGRVYVA